MPLTYCSYVCCNTGDESLAGGISDIYKLGDGRKEPYPKARRETSMPCIPYRNMWHPHLNSGQSLFVNFTGLVELWLSEEAKPIITDSGLKRSWVLLFSNLYDSYDRTSLNRAFLDVVVI
jgi:hypothetical protein